MHRISVIKLSTDSIQPLPQHIYHAFGFFNVQYIHVHVVTDAFVDVVDDFEYMYVGGYENKVMKQIKFHSFFFKSCSFYLSIPLNRIIC